MTTKWFTILPPSLETCRNLVLKSHKKMWVIMINPLALIFFVWGLYLSPVQISFLLLFLLFLPLNSRFFLARICIWQMLNPRVSWFPFFISTFVFYIVKYFINFIYYITNLSFICFFVIDFLLSTYFLSLIF